MKRRAAARAARQLACLLLLLGIQVRALGEDKLMLLVGSGSRVSSLSSVQVHKLFLGLTVIVDDHRLHAIRNDSDGLMRDVFFQNIVSMSEAVYDRRMLAMTLQQASQTLVVLRDSKAVFDALADDPDGVSFGWAADAARDPRVKALRVLWHP